MDLFPSRLCQPVARQQRSHLSPLQHAENNLGCACACELVCVCVCVRGGRRTVVNTTMQNPDADGPNLAITELGKLMLGARKNPTWFSSAVNELAKANGSLELGGEMRTELGQWAENQDRGWVKEGESDFSRFRPEDMDWDAVGHSILRYGRWKEIFLGVGMRWWQVGPVCDHILWIKVQFKGGHSDNL